MIQAVGASEDPDFLDTAAGDRRATVRAAVAANEHARLGTLERLAKASSSSIDRALAGNPSTPVSALRKLAKRGNRPTLATLASNPNTPSSVLARLLSERRKLTGKARDPEEPVVAALLGSPNTPLRNVTAFLNTPDWVFMRFVAAKNPRIPETIKVDWIKSTKGYTAYGRAFLRAMVWETEPSDAIVRALVDRHVEWVWTDLLDRKGLSSGQLCYLLDHGINEYHHCVEDITDRPDLPADVFAHAIKLVESGQASWGTLQDLVRLRKLEATARNRE
jgi:hypothetical protein